MVHDFRNSKKNVLPCLNAPFVSELMHYLKDEKDDVHLLLVSSKN